MKKLLLLFIPLLLCFSCGRDEDKSENVTNLMGKWKPYKAISHYTGPMQNAEEYALPNTTCNTIDYLLIKDTSSLEDHFGDANHGICNTYNYLCTYEYNESSKVMNINYKSLNKVVKKRVISLTSNELVLIEDEDNIFAKTTFYKKSN